MEQIQILNNIFLKFKINAECLSMNNHPSMDSFDVVLKSKTKIKHIEGILDEISLSLKLPNKPSLLLDRKDGIVKICSYKKREDVLNLLSIINKFPLPEGEINCLLGETAEGNPVWMDVVKNPHMIIAGTTGSGKSTLLHTIIANLLMFNSINIRLMDPKKIEFSDYNSLSKITVDYNFDSCLNRINYLCSEMERRFQLMNNFKLNKNYFPHEIVIIDEFADLILQDHDDLFKTKLNLLAQKSRAAGIHIILATQRPSVDIILGSIKSNFPARIACRVASSTDSKIILGKGGAEKLLGKGDALISADSFNMERFQVAYILPKDIVNLHKN